jgi:hypothetical protein
MKLNLVALSGWKQSGNDMSAQHLVKTYGYQRLAFADVLKEMVSEQYGISVESTNLSNEKEAPLIKYPASPKDPFALKLCEAMFREFRTFKSQIPVKSFYDEKKMKFLGVMPDGSMTDLYWTPRALCILEGSVKRTVNANYWVLRIVDKMKNGGNFVVTDVRYKNEVEVLQAKVLEMNPDAKIVVARIRRFDKADSQDPSEHDLDSYDFHYYLENKNVPQEAVYEQLDELVLAKGMK